LNKLYEALYPEFNKKDNPIEPLLEIDIEIREQKLRFNLEFHNHVNPEESIFGIIEKWIEWFTSVATFMDRADTIINKNTDYLVEVFENNSVRSLMAKIYRRIKKSEVSCDQWKNTCFAEFVDLFSVDSTVAFQSFLERKELYPTEQQLRDQDSWIKTDEERNEEEEEEEDKEEDEEDNIYKIDYENTR
jgi:hypothetical protein